MVPTPELTPRDVRNPDIPTTPAAGGPGQQGITEGGESNPLQQHPGEIPAGELHTVPPPVKPKQLQQLDEVSSKSWKWLVAHSKRACHESLKGSISYMSEIPRDKVPNFGME